MTTSTPLPELDEILEHLLIDYDFDVKDKDSRTFDRAKQAIRTLVLEEMPKEMTKPPEDCQDDAYAIGIMAGWNSCLKEQRKKLGGTHGTK